MKRIYSKIEPTKLILSELKRKEISDYRSDLSPSEEYLQISGRKLKKGIKVSAHKHLPIHRTSDITQEAWIILEGSIKGTFYDLDDSIIYESILTNGDCIVLYRGGHSLEVLDKDTLLYEFKTGPYLGVEKDKETIKT